jgi:hypothetical protein
MRVQKNTGVARYARTKMTRLQSGKRDEERSMAYMIVNADDPAEGVCE